MNGAVKLPGVRAQSPMGLLVALGALDLLAEHIDGGARLSWCEDGAGHCAGITVEGAATSDDVARMAFEAVRADPLDGLNSLAVDINKVTPEALHDVLSQPDVPRLLRGLCAEAPLRPDGQAAMTLLAIGSFKANSFVPAVLRADARTTEVHLRALFGEAWRYARGVASLALDPAARQQDSARMAADASTDKTRGVLGALSLAVRGLALVPPMPVCSGRGRRTRLAAVHEHRLVWPVWREPLTRFGVRALMGRSWGAIEPGDAALDACGVVAVYESEIIAAKDGRRLARAQRRA